MRAMAFDGFEVYFRYQNPACSHTQARSEMSQDQT